MAARSGVDNLPRGSLLRSLHRPRCGLHPHRYVPLNHRGVILVQVELGPIQGDCQAATLDYMDIPYLLFTICTIYMFLNFLTMYFLIILNKCQNQKLKYIITDNI